VRGYEASLTITHAPSSTPSHHGSRHSSKQPRLPLVWRVLSLAGCQQMYPVAVCPATACTLLQGAMVTFNRLFFRNFIPHSSKALTAAALDFNHSPVPFIVSKDGGQAVYNLVVLHWTRPMVWAFKQPGSFWQQAAEEKVRSVGDPQPLQLQTPALYSVKSFSTDAGTAAIADCFMPVDLDGCLSQQPFGTALIYW